MGDHEFSPDDLPRLRRGAHEFLRQHAARAWEHQDDGDQWEITLPPDVAALPGHQRFRVHARQEARRLAGAQLYDLDPAITRQAVSLGAAIRQQRHEEAVALAGHPGVAATLGIQPPTVSGFVRWRDGIGHNALGAPVVACHWGPACGGHWLGVVGRQPCHGRPIRSASPSGRAAHQPRSPDPDFRAVVVRPPGTAAPRQGSTRHDGSIPGPGPAADAGSPGAEDSTPGLALLYTTLATWWLLTCPDAAHLSQQPMPAAEQAADRAAGLQPRPVITATTARIP